MVKYDINTELKQIAQFLCQKGWAERNAGNFSYRTDESIIISDTGSKFRDIAQNPTEFYSDIKTDFSNIYLLLSSDHNTTHMPSSELASHYLLHKYLKEHRPQNRAIIHTHPTYLIAFSHKFYDFSDSEITMMLSETIPEVNMYIPNGLGCVESMPAGSEQLAEATYKKIQYHDVILWKKHGCLATAETFWDAIDLIDIMDKAAYISLLIHGNK